MIYAIAYVATALVFFSLDYLWLGTLAKDFYARELGSLMREKPDFLAAGIFYLFYIGGVVLFAVVPALQAQSWKTALVYGGLLGLFAYGTYDMTNLATLKGWPVKMVVVDMAWGTALTAASALMGYLAVRAAV
ncbi:DUF2177 family protein [Parvibaculum lavamentivorans]|nr:DUF2177 family protein [Parvibaculum lavamentivorans]